MWRLIPFDLEVEIARVQVQLELESIISLGSIISLESLVEFKLWSLIIRILKGLGFSGLYKWIVSWLLCAMYCRKPAKWRSVLNFVSFVWVILRVRKIINDCNYFSLIVDLFNWVDLRRTTSNFVFFILCGCNFAQQSIMNLIN